MRRAAALPFVLFVLALTSALAVSGSFVARQLAASANASQRGAELEPMCERALVDALAQWDSVARAEQIIGSVANLSESEAHGIRTNAWITRIGENTFWLVAESIRDARPPMRRRIGVLVRLSDDSPRLVAERAWSEFP